MPRNFVPRCVNLENRIALSTVAGAWHTLTPTAPQHHPIADIKVIAPVGGGGGTLGQIKVIAPVGGGGGTLGR